MGKAAYASLAQGPLILGTGAQAERAASTVTCAMAGHVLTHAHSHLVCTRHVPQSPPPPGRMPRGDDPQMLRQRHAPLTPLLGKSSGRDADKLAALRAAGWQLDSAWGLPVLAGVLISPLTMTNCHSACALHTTATLSCVNCLGVLPPAPCLWRRMC